jgi:hypothetical protein
MRALLILSLLVLSQSALATTDENSNGGYAGAFRRVGQSAALMGMGNAGGAWPMGAGSRLVNPALIGWWQSRQVSFDHHNLSLDRELNTLHLLWPMRPMGAFGVSFTRAAVDNIPETTTWGEYTGRNLNHGENAFSFGFSLNPARFLAIGMNMNIYTSNFEGVEETSEFKENTAGFDLGFSLHPKENLWFGASLQNLGASYAWDSGEVWGSGNGSSVNDDFPTLATLSAAGEFVDSRLLVAIDYETSNQEAWDLRLGVEWRSDRNELGNWALRAGWDDGSPTAGVGFAWPFARIEAGLDYAITLHENDPNELHSMTWRVTF